jgi:hypothetical protein
MKALSSRVDSLCEEVVHEDRLLRALVEAHLPRSGDADGRLPHSPCVK